MTNSEGSDEEVPTRRVLMENNQGGLPTTQESVVMQEYQVEDSNVVQRRLPI